MSQSTSIKSWFNTGKPWVWLNAGAVSISLVMVVGLVLLIAVRGLSHFWPADIMELTYQEPGQPAETLIGERIDHETVPAARLALSGVQLPEGQEFAQRTLLKVGNRDYFGLDFRWINDPWISDIRYPEGIMAIERREWGNFYGYLVNVKQEGEVVASGDGAYQEFVQRLERSNELMRQI
ncbi:MAG: phosphate ABC transporter, permease protein PstA, partial [Pseudomonadota bacterium]|nr:phosphate ABC transporter, permease protein PstA [Pseudomonadota bacterium]